MEPRPLHARRRRQKELADREAAGEDLWTEEFSSQVTGRIGVPLSALFNHSWSATDVASVRRMFRAELGVGLDLINSEPIAVVLALTGQRIDPGLIPSLIEAIVAVHLEGYERGEELDRFEADLNEILAEERIAFRLVEGQMVEFASMEMHTEVVEPAIRLLHRTAGWEKVERSYRNALQEIGEDPSDAITDAGTALQEALTLLGCKGNALGPLITDAKKKGLVAAHDTKLLDWVSADRSEKGDGHRASAATRGDAWLAVHVVGALILRLASDGDTRG